MRKDMAKVLVERPRKGGGWARKGRRVPLELQPKMLGMIRGAREVGGHKMLNENLAPLRRYLARQVGRPWNKVFSEISENLKSTSTVQQHVRDHIKDFVELHPSDDVRPYGGRWRWFQPFYVGANDGLLKRTDKLAWAKALEADRRRKKATAPDDRVALSDRFELRRLGGLWFEVRLELLPPAEYRAVSRALSELQVRAGLGPKGREVVVRQLTTPAVHDIVTGKAVYAGPELDEPRAWDEHRRAHPRRTYAVAKRQLSKKELCLHGLSNKAD